ncbi:MAG: hypothetical protein AAB857_00885 [Patescibacteria group bacterium]
MKYQENYMKKSVLVFSALLFAFPVVASAQMYHRPYYEQKTLAKVQTLPYFLENRTGSPLKVTLLVEFPNGGKEWWPFDIAPDSEVYAMLPLGGARVSVSVAVASVPKGNKIVSKKVKSYVYDREAKNGQVQRGWLFYRK